MISPMIQKGENLIQINPRYFEPAFWEVINFLSARDVQVAIDSLVMALAKHRGMLPLNEPRYIHKARVDHLVLNEPLFPDDWLAGDWLRSYWADGVLYLRRLQIDAPKAYRATVHTVGVATLTKCLTELLTPMVLHYQQHNADLTVSAVVETWYRYAVARYYKTTVHVDKRLLTYFEYSSMQAPYCFLKDHLAPIPSNVSDHAFHHLNSMQTTLSVIFQRRETHG